MIACVVLALWSQAIPGVRVTSEFQTVPGGREILSPALPRNAWSRFHLIVTGPPRAEYQIHIGQNPEEFAAVRFSRDGKPLGLPFHSMIAADGSAGIYRMEFFIEKGAPVRRVKLEPQIFMEPAGWIVYPMEARIVEATVPDTPPKAQSWRALFCGKPGEGGEIERQDLGLASRRHSADVRARFEQAAGQPIAEWCQAPQPPHAEWYLRFRDWLLRSGVN